MKTSLRLCLAAALASLVASGCTDVDSSSLKTSGIDADFTVIANGAGDTSVSAELTVDDSALTFVELKEGDSLSASVGDQMKFLQESKALGAISYYASFTGADAEGTEYVISLDRQSDTNAPNSTAVLPAPFSITAPAGDALSYSRSGDDIVVSYDNAGHPDPMSYTLFGDCIDVVSHAISDDSGTFTIPKATIALREGAPTTCILTLNVLRTREGTLDPAFAGGGSAGIQARSLSFTSTP